MITNNERVRFAVEKFNNLQKKICEDKSILLDEEFSQAITLGLSETEAQRHLYCLFQEAIGNIHLTINKDGKVVVDGDSDSSKENVISYITAKIYNVGYWRGKLSTLENKTIADQSAMVVARLNVILCSIC